ncbi:MAG: DNA-binding NtrC family response regulator [Granulosicoccus sp.]|jgi:DNA-binding NtrC family response regulator
MNKRYRLLFVDDEPRVLRALTSAFRRDYEVHVAASGLEALKILSEQAIDVLVSDQRMPHMTGDELLSKVCQQYPQVMRILLTGYVDKQAIINTINEGEIYRYLSKPWNIGVMKVVIAEAAYASSHQLPTDKSIIKEQKIATSKQIFTQKPSTSSGALAKEKTIMILMDKDQKVRNAIRVLSQRFGFSVYSVSSYMQAVRVFSLRPDVGVAIIGIAENTRETLEALNLFKQHRPDITVIVLTDYTDSHVAIDLINKGQVFRYLEKPVKSDQFERSLLAAIKRHKMLNQEGELKERYRAETWAAAASEHIKKLKGFFKKSA